MLARTTVDRRDMCRLVIVTMRDKQARLRSRGVRGSLCKKRHVAQVTGWGRSHDCLRAEVYFTSHKIAVDEESCHQPPEPWRLSWIISSAVLLSGRSIWTSSCPSAFRVSPIITSGKRTGFPS